MRALDDRCGGLKLVSRMILPLNQVVILALLTLDCSDHSFDLVDENGANACLAPQLINDVFPLGFMSLALSLDILKEEAFFHVLVVRPAYLLREFLPEL